MKLGVISDTHGYLDPQVLKLFADVDHILHAGDVGYAAMVLELEELAPVTAVVGNTDGGLLLRETEAVELAGRKILVHHIVNPYAPSDRLKARLQKDPPDLVVFGHTHKPYCEKIGRTMYFNPGYAGKPKLGTDRSVAILHLDHPEIRHEWIGL